MRCLLCFFLQNGCSGRESLNNICIASYGVGAKFFTTNLMSVDLLQNTPKTRKPIAERTSHEWHGYTTRGGGQQSLLHQTTATPPTDGTERTEPSCRERTPTDEHRWTQIRRVWHPCHTHAAKFCVFCEFCGRTAHHNNLCPSVPSVGEKIFPQNARNTQNLLAEKGLPQMSTDVHRLGGYGIPAIPTLPNSVYSVNSVGEQRTITICVHPCHPWEKRYSRRTHGTHRTFLQRKDSHR